MSAYGRLSLRQANTIVPANCIFGLIYQGRLLRNLTDTLYAAAPHRRLAQPRHIERPGMDWLDRL